MPSLARQNTLLLAVAFILVELLAAATLAVFLMLPVARRAADDLAGLMTLSAQTWAELPPETRADFEHELLASHELALRAEPADMGHDEWHPPFFYLLEDALARRVGTHQHLSSERVGAETWYWANLPAGDGWLAVGLPRQRIETQPMLALLLALGGGLLFAGGVAFWLARRITAPLARLEQAAMHVGLGERPELLPETGPRELAALAQRFNAMARQVRELLTARTTLLAGVSHDLRTPLARMRLALEMLKADPAPALIARLEDDIEEMNGLIATLLDLARGLEREPPVDLDLAELLAELAELAADRAAPDRVVTVHCPPCRRAVPPRALRRAIGNLLQNALRYAPDGPIELVCDATPERCRIGVLDRGPGIPPDRIEAMFEPFQRLDDSRSPQTGGAGLGLAIVRELAKVNGWQVKLEPRAGGGLAAWVELPTLPA
ncbi:MAG: ATP-binding protein [Rhodocyclaceae bacterium]|nr:ATP-binding protein [Rhodocyclaceae bacterium]